MIDELGAYDNLFHIIKTSSDNKTRINSLNYIAIIMAKSTIHSNRKFCLNL
ncbi:MAG: hypothetical protein BAJALOKI1v1_2340002 [Promethearchaeota archaeon]|nr:MAG: hypothetical protein BAJALOKI1v1_2340002 [Candidatus Lokiarchaeota archaeon]